MGFYEAYIVDKMLTNTGDVENSILSDKSSSAIDKKSGC